MTHPDRTKTKLKAKSKAKAAVIEVSDDAIDSDTSPTQSRYKQCVYLFYLCKLVNLFIAVSNPYQQCDNESKRQG
jgi:hypothetical protein